jgi:hypothetical protein
LINVFLEPTKVFSELKNKPIFAIPLLLIALGSALFVLLYFSKVDSDWFADYTLQASGKEMSAAEIEQAKAVMPNARTMGWISAPMAFLSILLAYSCYSLYFMLAGKITGNSLSFRQGLSLTAWANMPMLLALTVTILGALTMEPQTTIESLALTNIDPLLMQLPPDHAFSAIAKNFSLVSFWVWFLLALGWKTWFNTGWGQAVVVALTPSIVIIGVMAAFAAR